MMRKIGICCVLLYLVLQVTGQQQKPEVFRDMNAGIHERVSDLLERLTMEEKISLLRATSPGIPRLGIDKYYHGNEALHGVVRPGNFTVFPQAIGLASTWNPALLYEVATAISDEARARWNELERGKEQKGFFSDLLTFWSPTVNMARDPRWGRTPETYGEDPYLSGSLGVAFVRGLQGSDPRYLKVVSTPKHFVANNEEHNRFECNARIPEKVLREYYLPAFEACIRKGKAESIMTAYNAIDGVPCTVNHWLLKKVLREDWGFQGYVVSDCGAPGFLVSHHKYVKTPEVAATLALKAGLDLECGDDIFVKPLENAYKQYMISEAEIDSAAYHVLRARMKLGLFDDPALNPYNQLSPQVVGCEAHQHLALETARQSLVLLKNQQHFLPLNPEKVKSIAVVGINAGNCEFGDYSGTPVNEAISVLEGIRRRVGDQVKVVYAPWVSATSGSELISKAYFPQGLKAEYFDNSDLQGTPQVRTDENINFDPVNQAPDPFLPQSPLSIRWSGKLIPTISGRHTFYFATDDGCRLYLDGKLLIDSWQVRPVKVEETVVELTAGKEYQLTAEYFDGGGDLSAKLSWHMPDLDQRALLDLYGEAGEAVRSCDVTVAVVGINKSIEREGQDRSTIELPEDQQVFLREIYKTNPNTVVVLVAGSSLALHWVDAHIPAILNAWYPGEQGGTAVAEALFGDYNPGGRLPLTYYNDLNELPSFDDYDIRKGRTYQYFQGHPLYPFGYGLSYTDFTYQKLKVHADQDTLWVDFTLTNSGKIDGDEVAQVYIQFPESIGQRPLKQLKGFERVHVQKGKKVSVKIPVCKQDLRFWDEQQGKFIIPSGKYMIQVGASSEDIRLEMKVQIDPGNESAVSL